MGLEYVERYYNSIGNPLLDLKGMTIASLEDVSFIETEEVERIPKQGEGTGIKKGHVYINGEFTFQNVSPITYEIILIDMVNPNEIATFTMIGIFRESGAIRGSRGNIENITVNNNMRFSELKEVLKSGNTLSFEA